MPDVVLTAGPKVAGKRIPVPAVRNKRTTAAVAKSARRTAARAADDAARAAGDAARAAGDAARAAGSAASSAKTAASSARSGAKNAARSAKTGAETGRAAVQFAQNVMPRQRETRSTAVHRAPAVTAAIAAGVGLEYLLDPADGRRRRRALRDQTLAAGRRVARRGAQRARYAGGKAQGAVRSAGSAPRPVDDQTLADRVRTEIFRRPDAPKGSVSVGVVDSVVTLRGEVSDSETIRRLVDDAHGVAGVRSLQNLLHTPGVPAPTGGSA
jgi:osmotically-inducible protein OsmY